MWLDDLSILKPYNITILQNEQEVKLMNVYKKVLVEVHNLFTIIINVCILIKLLKQ